MVVAVEGTGSANLASPAASNTYTSESGKASGSFTAYYEIDFTVDRAAKTVAVKSLKSDDQAGTITATSLSGVDSYSLTTTCVAGTGCNTPPVTCSFSNVKISPSDSTATAYLQPTWGLGASHAAYAAGTVAFLELGGLSWTGPKYPCSNPAAGSVAPNAGTLPGLTAPTCGSTRPGYTLDIPIDKLGQKRFSLSESGSGSADSGCAIGTSEQASYTITAVSLRPVTTAAQRDAAFLKQLIASRVDLEEALKKLDSEVRSESGFRASDGYLEARLKNALNELYLNPPEMPAAAKADSDAAATDIKEANRQLTNLEQNGTFDPASIGAELNSEIKGAQSKLEELEEVM